MPARYEQLLGFTTRIPAVILVKTVEALMHNSVVHGERGRDLDLDAYVEEIVRLVGSYLTVGKGR